MEDVDKGCLMNRMGVRMGLVPAHPGSPRKGAVKRLCVCVYLLLSRMSCLTWCSLIDLIFLNHVVIEVLCLA